MLHSAHGWLDWASYWVGAIVVYPVAITAALTAIGFAIAAIVETWHHFFSRRLLSANAPTVTPRTLDMVGHIPVPLPNRPVDIWDVVDARLTDAARARAIETNPTPKQRVMAKLDNLTHPRPSFRREHRRRPINED